MWLHRSLSLFFHAALRYCTPRVPATESVVVAATVNVNVIVNVTTSPHRRRCRRRRLRRRQNIAPAKILCNKDAKPLPFPETSRVYAIPQTFFEFWIDPWLSHSLTHSLTHCGGSVRLWAVRVSECELGCPGGHSHPPSLTVHSHSHSLTHNRFK